MTELFRGEYVALHQNQHENADRQLAIGRIVLDRPAVRNALGQQLLAELERVLLLPAAAEFDLLILQSGSDDFCLGVDLTELAEERQSEQLAHLLAVERVLVLIASQPALTIALVSGRAFGAGADLAVVCDFRLGFPDTAIAFRGWRFGLALGTRRLVDRVGSAVAIDLLVSGRTVLGQAARDKGLLTHFCTGDADAFVADVCASLLEIPGPARRQLVALTRPALQTASSHDLISSVRADDFDQNLARFRAGLRRSG